MASIKKILASTAQKFDLEFIKRECLVYGTYGNYSVIIKGSGFTNNKQHIVISFCIKYGKTPDSISKINIPLPEGYRANVSNFRLSIYIPIKGSNKHNEDSLFVALSNLFVFFETRAFRNCDDRGVEGPTDIYKTRGEYLFLGLESASLLRTSLDKEAEIDALREERLLPGLLGALLGAILGSIVVLLIARIGYVWGFISILMGAVVVYGYKWKGLKLSIISSILTVLICTAFSYFVFRLDLALSIHKATEIDVSIGFCLANTKTILELAGSMRTYYTNMAVLVGPSLLGVIVAVAFELKEQKERFNLERL